MEEVKIKFGTDGFRGIIARDFTFNTVEKIIKAIACYLKNLYKDKNTIIIGYDPRFMAVNFAKFCANLLKDFGFRVILSSKVVPTPIVAFCAKYYPDSIGAIMLTASHNPKEYQGIKFIPNYGGPAVNDITDEILKYLNINPNKSNNGEIIEKNLEDDYFLHIQKLINFDIIKNNTPNIIFDGLYSSSIGYFNKLLDMNGIKYESYNMYHSSDFGGGLPEPKQKFMKYYKDGFITLANDGDADRYGVIDEKGNYISPNIILAVLLKYLSSKGHKGKMIKTVGVSALVDVVAKKLNVETITTPVGFKWLGEAMRNNETILAGEDSGGLSIGAHIPEKDGILACLLILEMLADTNKTLNQLVFEIKEFASCEFYTDRVDVKVDNESKLALVDKFLSFNKIADYKICSKLSIDGTKLFLEDSKTSLLIRKSGTEPLLRFYIESDNKDKLNNIKEFVIKNS